MRALFLLLSVAALRTHPDVVAFTLSAMPVEADGATVHVLDEGERLASALGTGLPADPGEALAEARRRLVAPEGRALRARLEAATAGKLLAARLGVEKLPAVVVDRRHVVYGVRDVRRAVELVAAWRLRNETETVHGSGPGASMVAPPDRLPAHSLPRSRRVRAGQRP